MEKSNFPLLEGIEILSSKAMSVIEAAQQEASDSCNSCTKSHQTDNSSHKTTISGTVETNSKED
ncbi:MAG: hypothetical protein II406_02740 [Bacteroidales bacterium]|nr:hypothetical protein [Bacteroidales bacterium]